MRRALQDCSETSSTVGVRKRSEIRCLSVVSPPPPLRGNEVARPGLMNDLVEAITRPGAGAVGMTTALWGAGGFGKTTLARLLAHCAEVRERFPDGVVWVTVGENVVAP